MANFEIKANIKFLTKLNWKPAKIFAALQQVYGESAPCRAVIYVCDSRREGNNLKMI